MQTKVTYQHCVLRPLAAPLREDMREYPVDWFSSKRVPANLVVHEATYGDEEKRVDVKAYFVPFTRFGVPICFSITGNRPEMVLSYDPVLGKPKYLELDVEYDSYAYRLGGEKLASLPRHVKMRLPEYAGRWMRSECIVPRATLSIMVISGVSNQMYAIMGACMIAAKTRRALAFPFRLLARNTPRDKVCTFDMPSSDIDVGFSHLFDTTAFLHCLPCAVVRTDDALPPASGTLKNPTVTDNALPRASRDVPSTISSSTFRGTRCETKEVSSPRVSESLFEKEQRVPQASVPDEVTEGRLRRALLHSDVWKWPAKHWIAEPSSMLSETYAVSHTHVVVVNPFFGVIPDSQEDYNACVDVFLSLRPVTRLQALSDLLFVLLKQRALETSGSEEFVVAHCRQENDCPWRTQASAFVSNTLKHMESAEFTLPPKKSPAVYMMGGSQNNIFWDTTRHHTNAQVTWMRKEQFLDVVPELAGLGFEEAALVDREIAIAAHYFIPFTGSSISSATVIERSAHGRRSSKFSAVDEPVTPEWLLDIHGNVLYSYTGNHPSVRSPIPPSTSTLFCSHATSSSSSMSNEVVTAPFCSHATSSSSSPSNEAVTAPSNEVETALSSEVEIARSNEVEIAPSNAVETAPSTAKKKWLVISPQAGFENRVRAMCSGILLAKQLGRTPVHAWLPERDDDVVTHTEIERVRNTRTRGWNDYFVATKKMRQFDVESLRRECKTITCYTEWMPGDFWYPAQSRCQRHLEALGVVIQRARLKEDATSVMLARETTSNDDTYLLLETSLSVRATKRTDERKSARNHRQDSEKRYERKLTRVYQKYFRPTKEFTNILSTFANVPCGVRIHRGDFTRKGTAWSVDDDVLLARLASLIGTRPFVLFSDDRTFRDEIISKLHKKACDKPLEVATSIHEQWKHVFIEFLALALKCDVVCAASMSLFATEAALFGGKPHKAFESLRYAATSQGEQRVVIYTSDPTTGVSSDIVRVTRALLEEAGVTCHVRQTPVEITEAADPGVTFVVLLDPHRLGGYGFSAVDNVGRRRRFILYNWEQHTSAYVQQTRYKNLVSLAAAVWDYSDFNCARIPYTAFATSAKTSMSLPVRVLPLGYHGVLRHGQGGEGDAKACCARATLEEHVLKRYDVLFYGSPGPHRDSVMKRLKDRGLKVQYLTACNMFGDNLDREIAQSRIVLNLHWYIDQAVLQQTRIVPLLAKGVLVVSERSADVDIDAAFAPFVVFCDSPEAIVDSCVARITDVKGSVAHRQEVWDSFPHAWSGARLLTRSGILADLDNLNSLPR
jgi:hypothetical protein